MNRVRAAVARPAVARVVQDRIGVGRDVVWQRTGVASA